jgi:cell division inhibitor SepF
MALVVRAARRGGEMSALRKAGVWLGLIEDDEDRGYDDDRGYAESGYRERDRESTYRPDPGYRESRYAEEFADDEDDAQAAPVLPRSRGNDRSADRLSAERSDRHDSGRLNRSSVRSITRSGGGGDSGGYATRDNLALAPQVQLRERAVVAAEEEDQRYQITTLHPTTYREARTIGEHFRDGVPVIINLTEMDEADARRLVDFAAGLAFGLRGTIERVTNRVFLLSPANVQVTAEDKAKIAEGGFFDQS